MRLALAAVLISFVGQAAAMTPEAAPADGTTRFAVVREGSRIGTHRIDIRRNGSDLIVESNLDIAVKVLKITVYRYRSTRVETWRDGILIAYRAETDDDGTTIAARGRATRGGFALDGTQGSFVVPADALPNNLWDRVTVSGRPLFDPDDGTPMRTTVADKGSSPPPGGGGPARHYHLTGDTDTQLWFAGGQLAGVRIKGRDGSFIDYLPE